MIKSVVKVLIAIAIANALWRVSSSYISYYRFKDSVDDLATHSGGKTESQLKDRVVELAGMYDEPVDPEAIDIRHDQNHITISTGHHLELFPHSIDVGRVLDRAQVGVDREARAFGARAQQHHGDRNVADRGSPGVRGHFRRLIQRRGAEPHDAERHFGRAAKRELNRRRTKAAFRGCVLRLALRADDVSIGHGVGVNRVDEAFFDAAQ